MSHQEVDYTWFSINLQTKHKHDTFESETRSVSNLTETGSPGRERRWGDCEKGSLSTNVRDRSWSFSITFIY